MKKISETQFYQVAHIIAIVTPLMSESHTLFQRFQTAVSNEIALAATSQHRNHAKEM